MSKIWSREDIFRLISSNDTALERAVLAIYKNQPYDEQLSSEAKYRDGKGFSRYDVLLGTILAKRIKNGHHLSPLEKESARRILGKYIGQLTGIANSNTKAKEDN